MMRLCVRNASAESASANAAARIAAMPNSARSTTYCCTKIRCFSSMISIGEDFLIFPSSFFQLARWSSAPVLRFLAFLHSNSSAQVKVIQNILTFQKYDIIVVRCALLTPPAFQSHQSMTTELLGCLMLRHKSFGLIHFLNRVENGRVIRIMAFTIMCDDISPMLAKIFKFHLDRMNHQLFRCISKTWTRLLVVASFNHCSSAACYTPSNTLHTSSSNTWVKSARVNLYVILCCTFFLELFCCMFKEVKEDRLWITTCYGPSVHLMFYHGLMLSRGGRRQWVISVQKAWQPFPGVGCCPSLCFEDHLKHSFVTSLPQGTSKKTDT